MTTEPTAEQERSAGEELVLCYDDAKQIADNAPSNDLSIATMSMALLLHVASFTTESPVAEAARVQRPEAYWAAVAKSVKERLDTTAFTLARVETMIREGDLK